METVAVNGRRGLTHADGSFALEAFESENTGCDACLTLVA